MKQETISEFSSPLLPREKLATLGKEHLSNDELVAIFLRTGIPGKDVLKLSAELIEQAGSLEELARLSASEIVTKAKGIGIAKAATLAAAFELGCRAIRETSKRLPLTGAKQVYDYMITSTRWLDQEILYVLLIDSQCRLIKKVEISKGSLNESIAHLPDIIKPAITHNAYAFILVHNHPSGNPNPSKADNFTTSRLSEAAKLLGIKFYDHIIMGKPIAKMERNYYSYLEADKLD